MSGPAVGIDSFSYHRYFGEVGAWEQPAAQRWTTTDFLDRAAALDVAAVSLQTVYLEDLSAAAMAALREQTRRRRLTCVLAWGHRSGLESGANPRRFDEAMACLDAAASAGAGLMRIVCGDQFAWRLPVDERRERLAPLLAALAAAAGERGIDLAVENHADFAMSDLVGLIASVAAPNLGICLDLGNAVRVGDDAVAAATLAGPLVRMVQVKDLAVQPDSIGKPWAWWPTVPLGRGDIDVAAALAALPSDSKADWFVEMANMHPSHADEDAAVAESVAYLRGLAG